MVLHWSAGHSDTGQRTEVVLCRQLVSSETSLVGSCAQHINLLELRAICLVVLHSRPVFPFVPLETIGLQCFFLGIGTLHRCTRSVAASCLTVLGWYCGQLQHFTLWSVRPEPVSPLSGTLHPFGGEVDSLCCACQGPEDLPSAVTGPWDGPALCL